MTTRFSFNKIKGRLAETIIQELFVLNNYNVYNYGMERTMPGITGRLNNTKSAISKSIRFMPDFIVQSRLNGELYYVEIKFRADGCFGIADLDESYPYKNAWFVIVSPGKIQAIHYNMLKKGKFISPSTGFALKKIKFFHLDTALVEEFEEYTGQLFNGVN